MGWPRRRCSLREVIRSQAPVVRTAAQERMTEISSRESIEESLDRVVRAEPSDEHEVAIVDPQTRARRTGRASCGEVWFAGPSVACGYWNRLHEDNAETFGATLTDAPEVTLSSYRRPGRHLRTVTYSSRVAART